MNLLPIKRFGVSFSVCLFLAATISITSCKKDDSPTVIKPETDSESESEPEDPSANSISPLPLVTVDTNGAAIIDEPKVDGEITVVGVDSAVQYSGKIAIEIRGSSSQLFPKKQYGFETRDAANEDTDVAFLSFPEEEDWILYAPYSDKSLIRNHLIYNLARDMGHYASRSELVELNLNENYDGLYVFMEKLKRDKNRIDINKLKDDEISGEDLTGGYIIKIDKIGGNNVYNENNSFPSNIPPLGSMLNQTINFVYDYPAEDDIVPEQKEYISTYVSDFETALSSENFTDSDTGYANYIDVDSFIDFFILNEFSNNVDGYRISTFLHKDKNEKLKAGPIWDFNIAFGNANYCGGNATDVWAYKFNERCPEDIWQVPFWWSRFLEDPEYVGRLKVRWDELRGSTLSNAYVTDKIDDYVAQIEAAEAAQDNFDRWPVLGIYVWPNEFIGDTYASEVEYLKSFVENRLSWLDSQIRVL